MKNFVDLKKEEIEEIGKFIEDPYNNIYGFTVVLKSGNLRNIVVVGENEVTNENIKALKNKYKLLKK